MVNDKKIFETAMQIRSGRSIDEHLDSPEGMQRLALHTAQSIDAHLDAAETARQMTARQRLEDISELRDQILESQGKTLEQMVAAQQTFMQETLKAQAQLAEKMVELLEFLKLHFKQAVVAKPDKPESKMPRRAIIHHSDGSDSTVEFGT